MEFGPQIRGFCCHCSVNLGVKCQKSCNPHGGVCHLTPNCEGSAGDVVVLRSTLSAAFMPEGTALQADSLGTQSAARVAKSYNVSLLFFCDTVSRCWVRSQTLSNLWHRRLYVRVLVCVTRASPVHPASCASRCLWPRAWVFLSPHVVSFLWKWISHCFIKFSSLSVIVTSTLFLCGGFWPLGVKPNRTENSAIHNQQEGKEMALLVQHNWKRKGKGYYSHLKLVLYQYCTHQSYFIGHVLSVHWHFSWFIIVIIRTYCVYKYTEHVVALGRELYVMI